MSSAGDYFQCPAITDEIIVRYRANYGLPAEVVLTHQMVQQHVDLERQLTAQLLKSHPGNRTEVWMESYDRLYHELPWLVGVSSMDNIDDNLQFRHFLKLIPVGSRVIEIGSGAGSLARYLTDHDRPCVATDISRERGGARKNDSVEWHSTDGVNLSDYEDGCKYDFVLSTQVIEHLHPDDIAHHFQGALALLKPHGSYIFNTPHAFLGPADLSRVFALDRARFMHLKEYTHLELGTLARRAGFSKMNAVYVPPVPVRARLPFLLRGRWFYRYITVMERFIGESRVPKPILRALLFHCDVFLIAAK